MNNINDETKIKITMAEIKKDIEFIKKSLEDNTKQHQEIMEKMDRWIKKAESSFAAKWTEKVLVWGMSIIGASILYYVMRIILEHKVKL